MHLIPKANIPNRSKHLPALSVSTMPPRQEHFDSGKIPLAYTYGRCVRTVLQPYSRWCAVPLCFYSAQDPSRLAYNSYNRLGQTASHGCVRLNVEDAKWIYDNCPVGTKVTIYDSKDPGPLGKPTPIRIDVNSPYRGWDPTDPDPRNPWLKLRPTIKGIKNKTIERTNSKVDLKRV